MKKILFFLLVTFAVALGSAQNIRLHYDGNLFGNNDTLLLFSSAGSNVYYIDIENTTSSAIQLLVNINIITAVSDLQQFNYCIGEGCFDGDMLPFDACEIAAGTILSSEEHGLRAFHINYDSGESQGISLVKFNFYDHNNPETITSLYVKIESSVGINDSEIFIYNFLAHPNPANSETTIQYKTNLTNAGAAYINIRNLAGKTLIKIPVDLSDGKVTIPLNDLSSGIYFYSLEVFERTLVTKKLIIK